MGNIWTEDKIKIKIYSGIKLCSETGLNTLICSCFACFGAPYLYSEDDVEEGGIEINKNNYFFHENGNFFRVEVGKILIFIPNHHFWMSGVR
jgi:hypothetical protein